MNADIPAQFHQSYRRHTESGVWFPPSASIDFQYSDGEEIEQRLARIIAGAHDLACGSEELASQIANWPTNYHLSPLRPNLLRPLEHLLKGRRVLEIGAGCGAITRYLGEQAATVVAVEGSPRRAGIAASRCRDLSNVQVICDNFSQLPLERPFDVVTLIGVLEYSPHYLPGDDPIADMLKRCRRMVAEDGMLIVAIENQLGLKYFAGAPEDHLGEPFFGINDLYGRNTVVTFGRRELERKILSSGFRGCEFHLPLPDYKMPDMVVHPGALSDPDLNLGMIVRSRWAPSQALPYRRLFSEEMAWPALVRNGLISDFANSFLVVASVREGVPPWVDPSHLVSIYSASRRRCFAKRTVLFRDGHQIVVVRRALYGQAAHPDSELQMQLLDEPYIKGELYIDRLYPIVNRAGWGVPELAEWARPWVDYLSTFGGKPSSPGSEVNSGETNLPPSFIDCTPFNLIEDEHGKLHAFDLEWQRSQPVLFRYVVFRGLWTSLNKISTISPHHRLRSLRVLDILREVMERLGAPVSTGDVDRYIQIEQKLQFEVCGASGTSRYDTSLLERSDKGAASSTMRLRAILVRQAKLWGLAKPLRFLIGRLREARSRVRRP